MPDSISVKGVLEIGGGACVSSCGGADRSTKSISLRCATGALFQSAVETAEAIRLATVGAPGTTFVDLPLLEQLTSIELLYVRGDQPVVLRIGAAEPVVTGASGTFPTLFVGGETLLLDVDGTPLSVTFDAADQSAAQVAARINAAFALAGYPTPRASVTSALQLAIEGVGTGASSTLSVTGGTGAATIGLGALPSAQGAGADVPVWGTMLVEFGVTGSLPYPPARIQFSGTSNLTVVAAGRTT